MKLCIIGIGLLGGSFALGLKEILPDLTVVGVDNNPEHAQKAIELKIVEQILSMDIAVAESNLIVLATPVNAIISLLPRVLDLVSTSAVVIDLGSTKELICAAVQNHPKRNQFVAVHPIAGTEYSGPEAAFTTLLKEKTMIICEQEKSHPTAVTLIEDLCRKLEMRISYMDAASHDLHLAYVSHLSHISSFALGITVLEKEKNEQNIFDMAGSGFSSTVRLAKSSPDMWAPIFTQNGKNISEALSSYIEILKHFKNTIDNQDEKSSYALMQEANEIRRILQGIK
ncbi:prephenate dehydrogenase [Adhaeribacter arboris]|uniref:Prephenate dehydrogenase n=1 Tax=Adhaeribacter arboris TaxID=2072846 RepID=A0A2T2YBC3_9BACT|nr:prephenate dehydrogenase [Adhaeribacter arboris]PSR52799.1 prephenate dehydrogenase [Adhaeribacter arboris]